MTGAGHNWVGAAEQLRSFVERAERLHAEREAIAADIKEVYAEAKGAGFCTRTLKKVIQRRRVNREERIEQDELLEIYEAALEGGTTERAPAFAASSRAHADGEAASSPASPSVSDVDFLG